MSSLEHDECMLTSDGRCVMCDAAAAIKVLEDATRDLSVRLARVESDALGRPVLPGVDDPVTYWAGVDDWRQEQTMEKSDD